MLAAIHLPGGCVIYGTVIRSNEIDPLPIGGEHDQVACDQIGRLPWGLDDLFLNGKIPTDVPADDQLREKRRSFCLKKIGNKNVRTGDR